MCGAREFGINYQKQAACCVTVQTESRQMMEPIHVLAAKIQPKIVPQILEGCKDSFPRGKKHKEKCLSFCEEPSLLVLSTRIELDIPLFM
jgi:hypothetical protein